jgi:hypothetical protein
MRLSAAGDRMNALMYAVVNMGPAIEAFQGAQGSQGRQQGARGH